MIAEEQRLTDKVLEFQLELFQSRTWTHCESCEHIGYRPQYEEYFCQRQEDEMLCPFVATMLNNIEFSKS